MKLALNEWRHWLEGAGFPFHVFTDYRNVEYLQKGKKLNPHQARWSLFFLQFNFKVTHLPCKKNVNADAHTADDVRTSYPTGPLTLSGLSTPLTPVLTPPQTSLLISVS